MSYLICIYFIFCFITLLKLFELSSLFPLCCVTIVIPVLRNLEHNILNKLINYMIEELQKT